MLYFAVSYNAVINGTKNVSGTVGVKTFTNDYKPTLVKAAVTEYYKRVEEHVRYVSVKISGYEKLDAEEFEAARKDFVTIVGK